MKMPEIKNCPSTLASGFEIYSPSAVKRVFNNKKVSHILPYNFSGKEVDEEIFNENRKRISISGVREKLSLLLERNVLRLAKEGEQGEYILKPIPRDVKKVEQVSANEHLTMQIARQVFKIRTAENALIFFASGEPAYITRRFDIAADGKKLRNEDFASLAGKSGDNDGPNYKYHYSYEELGLLIQKYVPSWKVEIEQYFSLVIFNYLFSNGDAHLKNFGLLETAHGDFTLSPAYDLLDTRIHVDDPDFALEGGLFADNFRSGKWKINNSPNVLDFLEFGRRLGISEKRREALVAPFLLRQDKVSTLIGSSFLAPAQQKTYLLHYNKRRNLLK